mgnify:CR=1 FL=1
MLENKKGAISMFKQLLAFKNAYLCREDGATAIEYGLIAGAIALTIAGTVVTFGEDLNTMWTNLSDELQTGEGEG